MRIRGGGMFGGIGRSGRRVVGCLGVMRYEVMTYWFFWGFVFFGVCFLVLEAGFLLWRRG